MIMSKRNFRGDKPIQSPAEIQRYRNISTERKLIWLDEMRKLFFACMTPELMKRWEAMRKKGF